VAEYWEVIYKAIADFGDVLSEAAKAKAALEDVGKAAKDEGAAETRSATAAAAAHKRDTDAINEEKRALLELAAAAKLANVQSLYGGRSSMEQHLSDEQSEVNLTSLLNRQKWLGFTSPQQAYAWRQQEYNQRLLMNRAEFAGYTTPDQYLQYLVKYRTDLDSLNSVMRQRLGLFQDTAVAASSMNQSMGEGGKLTGLGDQIAGLQQFASAVNAVPDQQVTVVDVNDSAGIAELARWSALLRGIPDKKVTTLEVIRAAVGMGGVPVTGQVYPQPAPEIGPRPVLGMGGGAGGGGGGGPPPVAAAPPPEEPVPSGAAAAAAAAAAEGEAAALKDESAAAKDALAHLYQLAAAETDAARIAQIGSAINAIYAASIKAVADAAKEAEKGAKDTGDEAEKAAPKLELLRKATDTWYASMTGAGFWGAWTQKIPLFAATTGLAAGGISLLGLSIHLLIDTFLVLVPAVIAATAALGAFAVAAEPAAKDIIAHMTGVHTALDALGTGADQLNTNHIGPLTTKMGTLNATMTPMPTTIRSVQAAMAPTIVTIFGAAFSNAGMGMRIFQSAAVRTGTFVEDMVVKIQNALSSKGGQKGLADFITTATADMKILMGIGASILKIFADFVQAGQMTHVAELVFEGIAYVLSLIQKVIHAVGPDVLALGIAFVSVWHYGGALVTVLNSMLLALIGLGSKLPLIGDSIAKLAPYLNATNEQLIKMGALSPDMEQMAGYFAKGDSSAIGMANSLGLTRDQLVKVVAQNPEIQDMAKAFGISAEQAAANAIAVTASGKSIEEYAADSAIMNEEIAASIAELEVEQREMALLGVTASASSEKALAGIEAMGAGEAAVAAETDVMASSWAYFAGVFAASGIGTIIVAIAAIAAAVLLITENWNGADTATKKFVSDMQTSLGNLSASQAFAQIPKNIASIGFQLDIIRANSRNTIGNMAQGWHDLWSRVTSNTSGIERAKGIWDALWQSVTGTSSTKGDINKLLAEQTQEMKDWSNEVQTAASTANKYGVSVAQSFALMDLAGVKASDSEAVQLTKVNDLVAGWINMGVTGLNTADGMNRLGGAINAVTLASEIQNSQIGQLTQSFTTFLGLVTGGETAFETYATGLNTIKTNAGATGASMTGLNAASLTLRQSWESNLSAGQGLYNNLLLQNAAAGNNAKTNAALSASGRDIVNSLLAQGGATQESVSGAYALAQTMGYTGKATYDALEKWSGGNLSVKQTSQDLNKQVGLLEGSSANLTTDVKNLAAAINTNLNQAIAQGLIDMPKMVTTVSNVRDAVHKSRDEINKGVFAPPVISSAMAFYNSLVAIFGTTPAGLAQAKAEFETVYADLGVKKGQADKLWNSIAGGDVAKLKPPKVNVDTSGVEAKLKAMDRQFSTPPSPSAWQKFMSAAMAPPSVHNFIVFFQTIGGLFTSYVLHPILIAWNTIYTGFFNDFQHPLSDFFNKLIPNFVVNTIRLFDGMWSNVAHYFGQYVVSDVGSFFTKMVPHWLSDISGWFARTWFTAWHDFDKNVLQPFLNFWTRTFPGWLTDIGKFFRNTWFTAWHDFDKNLLQPFDNFWTRTVPGWLSSIGRDFLNLWKSVWKDFDTHILAPFGNWCTRTVPNAVQGAFKTAINWVIDNTINKVINFLNNDVLKYLPGGLKIGTVGHVAAGGPVEYAGGGPFPRMPGAGSVPGASAVDGYPIMAMGGEYMLRQPARTAIDQAFGTDFLPRLNQADSWLGAGSRGTSESQRRFAAGGGVPGYQQGGGVGRGAQIPGVTYRNPVGPGAVGSRIDMGVDYTGTFDLFALGAGTIRNLYNSQWPGGTYMTLQLDEGQYKNDLWYYAEHIQPAVGVNQHVQAGQRVGHAPGGYPWTELGFSANATGETMAAASGQSARGQAAGDPGRYTTAWGALANNVIVGLGGPAGTVSPGGISGSQTLFGKILSFFSQLWQSVEGLLNSAGSAISDKIKPLTSFVAGGASGLFSLAKKGARAVIDGIWDHTVTPITKLVPGDTFPGQILQSGANRMKSAIDSFFDKQDSQAKQTAASSATTGMGVINPVSGPADAGPGQAEHYAQTQLSAHGWPASEFAPLQSLWQGESGWSRFAKNPGSGAYGIPQSLPESKLPAAGQSGGGSHASPQIDWGLNYIKSVPGYGSPSATYAKWLSRSPHWYALGGPVIQAIMAATKNTQLREAMGLATNLASGWNTNYFNTGISPHEYGAFAMPTSRGKTSHDWQNISKAVGWMLPRFNTGLKVVGASKWGRDPEGAATSTADWAESRTFPKLKGQARVNQAWVDTLRALGIKAPKPVTPGPKGKPAPAPPPWRPTPGQGPYPPTGLDAEDAWQLYSTQLLPQAVSAEMNAFWALYNAKLPKGTKPAAWASWYADEIIQAEQQEKTIGMGVKPAGAYMLLQEYFDRPDAISPYWWTNFANQLNTLVSWQGGPGVPGGHDPPSSAWHYETRGRWPRGYKPGHIKPEGYWGWKDLHTQWQNLRNKLLDLKKKAGTASSAWKQLYAGAGTAGGYIGPGTPAPQPAPPPIPGLEAIVTLGGPGEPVIGAAPDAGYGFASGGLVNYVNRMAGGGPVDFTSMFALGGPVPFMPPSALSFSYSGSPSGSEFPRALSAAGAAGRGIGFNVETMTINNPVAEQPSQSIARASNRLAFLAGRGMA
jgi:hypothetical protein